MSNLFESMVTHESAVINRCYEKRTDKIGAYRMIHNTKVDISSLIERLQENCVEHLHSSHVLCIEDTTELNYTNLTGRLEKDDPEVGPMSKNSNRGFFCHPTLVIDAKTRAPAGYSYIRLWNRSSEKKDKHSRKYHHQRIQDKESYRWIESAQKSALALPKSVTKTIIADRESDIYEALFEIPRQGCELLIRSSANRQLDKENLCLLEKMQSLESRYSYELQVKGNHSRKTRTALMELRYGRVRLSKPSTAGADCPKTLDINCIYMVEKGTVPSNESPIEWRLLTTHPIDSIQEVLQCVEWYKCRWYIEEVFRLLKSKGLDVESAQLEDGETLKKMVSLALVVALHLLSLKISYDKEDQQTPALVAFTPLQIELLKVLLKMTEGKTAKQKNPFKKESLAWAAWIIARLGGWDGYKSQGPPGYITFRKGLEKFWTHFRLFQFVNKDVYKE